MAARITPSGGGKPDKLWADALRIAVSRDDGKGRRLALLAEKCAEMALGGDMQAIKEIGDRLDGKPRQQIEHGGEDGGALKVEIVKFANP